jgi:hypothetical protein
VKPKLALVALVGFAGEDVMVGLGGAVLSKVSAADALSLLGAATA